MTVPTDQECPHCKRDASAILEGKRCLHCGAVVCGTCDERIKQIDGLLAEDGQTDHLAAIDDATSADDE